MSSELGNADLQLKHYAEAEKLLKDSLALFEKNAPDDGRGNGQVLDFLANVYMAQDEAAKAEPLLLRSLKIYKQGAKKPANQDDLAWYGRHLAMTSFWLVAMGTSSNRLDMAQDHCKDVREYSKWVTLDQRDIMTKGCDEVMSKTKEQGSR